MPLQVDKQCRDFVASWEGFSAEAYLCPAGVWTIGFGHTQGVQPGDRVTLVQAGNMLAADLVAYGVQVGAAIGNADTDQQEFNSMVSLAFNVGVAGFRGSTVLRLHKKGDKAGAARAFAMWNKATINGVLQPVLGLTRRRAAETALYLTPDEAVDRNAKYVDQVAADEMPQKVAPDKTAASSKTIITGAVGTVAAAGAVADQVQSGIDAAQQASYAAANAVDTFGAIKAAAGSFFDGRGLVIALTLVALGCIVFVVGRYWLKKRAGETVST